MKSINERGEKMRTKGIKKIRRTKKNKKEVLLREYREMLGMSQMQVAKMVDVNQRTISTYELGIRKPPIKTAIKLARLFHVQVDDLFPIEE